MVRYIYIDMFGIQSTKFKLLINLKSLIIYAESDGVSMTPFSCVYHFYNVLIWNPIGMHRLYIVVFLPNYLSPRKMAIK
jgi:hypothetical protein